MRLHLHRRAHVPAIHAASHVDHEKRVEWFSISMHTCGSVSIVIVLCLAALRIAGALLISQDYIRIKLCPCHLTAQTCHVRALTRIQKVCEGSHCKYISYSKPFSIMYT